MASTIGIKIANGEFYSIIEENSSVKKRLVLTTVHDKQRSVQIDLYKSFTKTMADALYIGSLVVESIKPRPKGEPSIELVISSTPQGEISADAIDLDASSHGEHQYLNVSLKSIGEDNRDLDIPDFELEQHDPPPSGLYEKARAVKEEEPKKFPWLVVICAGLVLAALCLLLWLFLFRGKPGSVPPSGDPPRPAVPPAAGSPPPQPPQAQPASPLPPVISAPAAPPPPPASTNRRNRPEPPVASYRVPASIPKEGAPYRIRWGDTLWDISEAFYRDPLLYPRIARFNRIRNPDLIISGTTIRIPPKN